MVRNITLDDIRRALALPDAQVQTIRQRMTPRPNGLAQSVPPRKAGVLVLLFPQGAPDAWHVLLTRRTDHLRGHSGQVSFPGGQYDDKDPDFAYTALRETCEELGICQPIPLLGQLSKVYIPPSNFDVYPSVGWLTTLPPLCPNPDEVAEVFSMSLQALLDPTTKQHEVRTIQGYSVQVPYYAVQGHKVWGATAAMLGELEGRLRLALGLPLDERT